MANEIQATIGLTVSKSGAAISTSGSKTADMTGTEMITNVQAIGFADAEAIVLGDVTTVGYIAFKNLDTTNFVELALDEPMANKFAKLLAGDLTLIKAATATIYAKADTASVNLLVSACEL